MDNEKLKQLRKINDICFYVKDFKGSLKFFTEKFGFSVKRLQPTPENANYAEFDFMGTTVSMWERTGVYAALDKKYLGGEGHNFMIAIKVETPDDVDSIYEELTARGVTCISKPETYPFGARASYYQDHEQNIWEVFAWQEGGSGPGLL